MKNRIQKIGRLEGKRVSCLNKVNGEWRVVNGSYRAPSAHQYGPLTTHHSLLTNKKAAFTLAEVLITLGIIGVVAAITMPTLITNYQKKQTIEKLKSTYSILSNAIEHAIVDNGDANGWTVPVSEDKALTSDYFYEHYMKPYLKVIKDCNDTDARNCNLSFKELNGEEIELKEEYRTVMLSNGAIVSVEGTNTTGTYRCIITVFINGIKKNSRYGRDVFEMELGGWSNNKNRLLPYGWGSTKQVVDNNGFKTSCKKDVAGGAYCMARIVVAGWQMDDDYPW